MNDKISVTLNINKIDKHISKFDFEELYEGKQTNSACNVPYKPSKSLVTDSMRDFASQINS